MRIGELYVRRLEAGCLKAQAYVSRFVVLAQAWHVGFVRSRRRILAPRVSAVVTTTSTTVSKTCSTQLLGVRVTNRAMHN
jgi:hypothetical protein